MLPTGTSRPTKTPGKSSLSDFIETKDLIHGNEYQARSSDDLDRFEGPTFHRVIYYDDSFNGSYIEVLDDFPEGHHCDGLVPSGKGWWIDSFYWEWKLPYTPYDPEQQPFDEGDI
jgi:hypothetical protein